MASKTAKSTKVTLETVCRDRYGISIDQADALVLDWAATYLGTVIDPKAAADQWRRENRRREKLGRYTSFPVDRAHPLHDAYYGRKAA